MLYGRIRSRVLANDTYQSVRKLTPSREYTMLDARQRGLVGERRAFIEKPFTVDQITRRVCEVLDQT